MARKTLLIVGAITLVVIVGVMLVVIVGGIWFMRSRNRSAALVRTAVGQPKGSATTKTIGAEGGIISSADGRITVTVSPKSLAEKMNFSIQPLTNMAPGGLGDAYRLEPSGQDFSMSLNISFKPADGEIAGKPTEEFALAYQDRAGLWQTQYSEFDKENKTYTVSTTHFSDWSLHSIFEVHISPPDPSDVKRFSLLHIEPPIQTIKPGQSTYVELVGCDKFETWTDRLDHIGQDRAYCGGWGGFFGDALISHLTWQINIGSIEQGKFKVKYTAPAANRYQVANVTVPFTTTARWSPAVMAKIIIQPSPYKASGQNGPVTYSGTICSLGLPFKVTVTNPPFTYEINFVPTDKNQVPPPKHPKLGEGWPIYAPFTTGTFSYSMTSGMLHMSGQGYYTIEGEKTDHPVIVCHETSEAHGPMGIGSSGKGIASIQLTPLDTNECGGK